MHESKRLKRVSLRYAALFFVVFGLIFASLGIFVYQMFNANLFQAVDRQILLVDADNQGSYAQSSPQASPSDTPDAADTADAPATDSETSSDAAHTGTSQSQIVEDRIEENPQTILLARDANGAVTDTFGIYSTYPNFFEQLPFDSTVLDTAYLIEQNGHHYRAANYKLEPAEEGTAYLQMIVNVDSEMAILDQFGVTLTASLIAALIICAGASYLLSRQTLRPIAKAWEKQTEFVQNASHELRTPLTVIRTTQELLLEEPNARIIDKFEDISVTIEEAGRLSRLTEGLLSLTTADADEGKVGFEQLDLDELTRGVAAVYEDMALTQERTLEVDTRAQVQVQGNRDKLRQLLAILLDNALKYTEEGGTVRIATQTQGTSASVSVSDDGVGVSDEDLARVFDRFYRADKARSRETGGNGLGLSIAKSIMDVHGGSIKMERNATRGVTVTATFKNAGLR